MIAILKHIQIEGPGILGDIFAEHGLHTECIELEEGKALPDIKECEGVVILGGPMNVYEEQKFSFLRDEDAFLKKVIQERIPALGICLGAQLLAKACGAVVKRSPVKEIGWYPIKLTPQAKSDLLFSGLDDDLDVFQWHEDTFEIPSSGVLMASGLDGINQAMRIGPCAWGVQFHFEVTADIIGTWIKAYMKEGMDKREGHLQIELTNEKKNGYFRLGKTITENFIRVVTGKKDIFLNP